MAGPLADGLNVRTTIHKTGRYPKISLDLLHPRVGEKNKNGVRLLAATVIFVHDVE
jgi:hypothetical protein